MLRFLIKVKQALKLPNLLKNLAAPISPLFKPSQIMSASAPAHSKIVSFVQLYFMPPSN